MDAERELSERYAALAKRQFRPARPNDGAILEYKDYARSLTELARSDDRVLRVLGEANLVDPEMITPSTRASEPVGGHEDGIAPRFDREMPHGDSEKSSFWTPLRSMFRKAPRP
jgi:hypothetical protein